MPYFIIASFLFLALGFYELSGGAKFDPEAYVEARIAEHGEDYVPAVRTARVEADGYDPNERLRALQQARAEARTEPAPAQEKVGDRGAEAESPAIVQADRSGQAKGEVEREVKGLSQFASATSGEAQIIKAAAIGTAVTPRAEPAALRQEVSADDASRDLREVTASSVNVRMGPSTDTGILTRVSQGQKVEVLRDNGEGWLRLRLLPEDRVGWIAASLVSQPTE